MKIKMLDKTLKISSNKKFFNEDIYVQIPDDCVIPEGTLSITENGSYTVDSYKEVTVNVPNVIPEGYIKPEGTITIEENGTIDVTEYATVNVNVSGSGDNETIKELIERSATSIIIPDGITVIGNFAFNSCYTLTSVTLPNSVTEISTGAFGDCINLPNITIPNNITRISTKAFQNCIKLTSISLPSNLQYLGNYAFDYCEKLQEVIFEENIKITSISPYLFKGCTSLPSIEIPNNVNRIGGGAFEYCHSLTNLVIPSSVTSIGDSALRIGSPANKATIKMENSAPPTITTNTFDYSALDRIEVPMSAVDTYKSATNWSNFADYIVGYE